MFERFTRNARDAVIQAQTEAAELGDDRIGTEHLLLGVLWNADGVCKQVLDASGIHYRSVREQVESGVGGEPLDPEALAGIGIDLAEVRRRVEDAFGPGALNRRPGSRRTGHIPFRPEAKKVLELALRAAISLHHNEIRTEHILLGLTRLPTSAAGLLITATGQDPRGLGQQLRDRLRHAA